MLDFRRGLGPRNYLSRREQWRLLVLVMSLGLVLVLAMEARKPENFAWLWGFGENGVDGSTVGARASQTSPVDTRVQSRPVDDAARGAFLSPAASDAQVTAPERYFRGVKSVYLDSIRDDCPFRYAEREAWFHLLDILRENDEGTLDRASTGRATFVQLFRQSEQYRGELVTIRGTLRRAHRVPAPKNEYGFDNYYQTWVTPDDNPSNLIVVYCLRLPEGFPTGMKVSEQVEVNGFFFKRWLYNAQDGVRTAPVLLARSVRWQQEPRVVHEPQRNAWSVALMIAGATLFAVLVTVYVSYRARPARPPEPESLPEPDALQDVRTSPDVGQLLEQLSDQDQTPGP